MRCDAREPGAWKLPEDCMVRSPAAAAAPAAACVRPIVLGVTGTRRVMR
jgi:hypothetical protein